MNSRENVIWLGGNIDLDLSCFLPKGFGIGWIQWEILKLFLFQQWSETNIK
jgi:hypothetical protein